MKRASIYLEEEELKLLKHLAVEEEVSLAELVRRAVRWYLATAAGRAGAAGSRERMVASSSSRRRAHCRSLSLCGAAPAEETEAQITAAREEVRGARLQRDAQESGR